MINGKSVLGITLARGGSKRVPRKNIIDINGKKQMEKTINKNGEITKEYYEM